MRGRKPVPTVLKLVRGNPGRRPIPIDEFTPIAKKPACPRHLKAEARKEWNRLTKILKGVVSDADRTCLSLLCTAWARHLEAEAKLEADGAVLISPKGYPLQSPWLAISNRAHDMHVKLCVEFGLTPSSRTRVSKNASRPMEDISRKAQGWGQF